MRGKESSTAGGSANKPQPSWLAGATIGWAILSLAGSAMAFGAGLALTQPTRRRH